MKLVPCRNRCGAEVVYEDQHLVATPDGDAWLCNEANTVGIRGATKAPTMSTATRQQIESDKKLVGRAFIRLFPDGSVECIPATQVIIDEAVDRPVPTVWTAELLEWFNRHDNTTRQPGPEVPNQLATPVPMWLSCPKCGTRHIDEGEFATKPHHTHACQNPECGLVWRPALVPTVGVKTLPGFLNEPKRHPLNPGDGPMEFMSIPNDDGSFTVHKTVHHKGCNPKTCACQPIHMTDRHYPKDVVKSSGDDGK